MNKPVMKVCDDCGGDGLKIVCVSDPRSSDGIEEHKSICERCSGMGEVEDEKFD